jgi:hypothetical protein
MKDRTHFAHRLEMCDSDGEVAEHLAEKITSSPSQRITPRAGAGLMLMSNCDMGTAVKLRQGDRVIADSQQDRPR